MTGLPSFCLRVTTSAVFLWDVNVSVMVVVTRKSNTVRNFSCTVLQCPVVLTSLNLAWSPLPCLPLIKQATNNCSDAADGLANAGQNMQANKETKQLTSKIRSKQ